MLKDNLKKLRLENKMSQTQFAKKLHVTQGAVSQWENGRTMPDTSLLLQIASVFNVPLDYLNSDHNHRDFDSLSEYRKNQSLVSESKEEPQITDEEIRYALSGGEEPITRAQFEEVKQFVKFIRERDKNNGNQ